MNEKLVYDFDEPCEDGRHMLGGKGLGLAEMTPRVAGPAGFTVTTEACRVRPRAAGSCRSCSGGDRSRTLATLERVPARASATRDDPLLVSVRSGGPVSMPGMMETILNLGLTATPRSRQAPPETVRFASMPIAA